VLPGINIYFVKMPTFNVISWFDKDTVKHLRIPFSYHLMPVFLFALSQSFCVSWPQTILAFGILHLLIYPSSNGYNSYQDKDEGSIGGLKHPPKVTENLFYATLFLDVTGILLALFVNIQFSFFVLIYVMISRAYSYRNLRLKKYALTGFLTVFLFQGAFTYLMAYSAFSDSAFKNYFSAGNVFCMCVASLFIGSVYPLTQIYQHEADKKDGVTTISYKLGYLGTFFFSAFMFLTATFLLYYYFSTKQQLMSFVLFNVLMIPVVLRLAIWFLKVRKDSSHANFENTMSMNLMASSCMNVYFLILILNNIFIWF
jgi:1,4-dihydroxy-2-naphthoate octaprenyltransferase